MERNTIDIEQYAKHIFFYVDEVPELLLKYLYKTGWELICDLGCGDGTLLLALKRAGYLEGKTVYAVDLSGSRVDLVSKLDPDFTCIAGDVCDLPGLEDGTFDFVVSTYVIEHVFDDEKMIREISRLVRPGGTVYLSTVFKNGLSLSLYRCNGRRTMDRTHLREYTDDSQLTEMIEECGFSILENHRSPVRYPIIDFFVRRLSSNRNIYNCRLLRRLRILRIRMFGYYHWELVLRSIEKAPVEETSR